MKKRSLKVEPQHFLSGWKEIANFLGKGVRTVQRYERDMGLPVRRPAGKDRGSVVAVVAELDGWVKASPIREVFRLRLSADPSPAQQIRDGLSELTRLREQLLTLRSELHTSLERLQDSVYLLQGEVARHTPHDPSNLYSWDEADLLDRTASDVTPALIKYPRAS